MTTHSHTILRRVPREVVATEMFGADLSLPVADPAPTRAAATVVVLSERAGQVCTWLMQRHANMPFAPNTVVYPGGSVDPADMSAVDPIRAAAVRELAEEADLQVDPEELLLWARWVTPEFHNRRYDTWFYLAVLASGQQPRDISGEADRADWLSLNDALAASAAGALRILPPTWSVLRELADYAQLTDIVDAAKERIVEPVLGRVRRTADGYTWVYPGDQDY